MAEPAPLGFVLKPPDGRTGLHSVIDRSGLVLGRARTWRECVAVLAEHLASFAPTPPGTIRTSMRAVIRGEGSARGAVLAGFPLLTLPPLIERQLERRGQCVIDRLAVDMTLHGELLLSALPWPELRPADPVGHCGANASGTPIEAVLLPSDLGTSYYHHQLVALIACAITSLAPEEALNVAEHLTDRAHVVLMNDVQARLTRP